MDRKARADRARRCSGFRPGLPWACGVVAATPEWRRAADDRGRFRVVPWHRMECGDLPSPGTARAADPLVSEWEIAVAPGARSCCGGVCLRGRVSDRRERLRDCR